ncbi:MAG: hypothetical protein ACHQLA_00090 [Ignavibacteriales bacterium]
MMNEKKVTIFNHDHNSLVSLSEFLLDKIKTSRFWFTVTLCSLISITVMAGLLILGQITGITLRSLTIDPADIDLRPAYIGMLSHFGIMLWSATAAICFFATKLINRSVEASRFLLVSGIVCSVLLFDDALLLHDRVFPVVFKIPETLVYLCYIGLILAYFFRFIHTIRMTEYRLLFIASSLFCISILMDSILPLTSIETFIEDGLKFTGILFWSAYFISTASSWVSNHVVIE